MPAASQQLYAASNVINANPSDRIYELVMRQEPKQARMCGVGGKADRRPIDPPPIVQLRVIDPAAQQAAGVRRRDSSAVSDPSSPALSSSSTARPHSDEDNSVAHSQSFLQNPYYFMFACLARPDDDAELHWLKDGRTRCTTGSVVSSLYHLKDPDHNNEEAGFFVFPDLSVRTEGSYRLKLSLFEVVHDSVRHCKSIFSTPFYVYTAKKFPGMEESTPLSCSLADQGIKIRIRKDIRVRKRPIPALSTPLSMDGAQSGDEDDHDGHGRDQPKRREAKRTKLDDGSSSSQTMSHTIAIPPPPPPAPAPAQSQGSHPMPWPAAASANPHLGSTIPPPPPNSAKPGQDLPPPGAMSQLPGPSVFDGRGGGVVGYDISQSSQPPVMSQAPSQPPQYSGPPAPQPPPPVPAHAPAPPPQQAQPTQPLPPQQYSQPHPPSAQQGVPPQQHGPPPNAMPPPPPQGYPYWGAPAPAMQPPYEAYYHHHQQHPPNMHPAYGYQHGRYDYSQPMYAQPPPPPAMPQYNYYEQPQGHPHQLGQPSMTQQSQPQQPGPPNHQPPPPHGPPPQYTPAAAPVPTASTGAVPPAAVAAQQPQGPYDYAGAMYRQNESPQQRQPYPPPPQAPSPYAQAYSMPPRHTPYPPHYPYAPYGAPPPTNHAPMQTDQWASPPAFNMNTGAWDYNPQQAQGPPQHPPQQQPPPPQQQQLSHPVQQPPAPPGVMGPPPTSSQLVPQAHSQPSPSLGASSPSGGGMVGNVAQSNDRIQLAPLLHPGGGHGPGHDSPVMSQSGGASNSYSMVQLRSSSRNGSGTGGSTGYMRDRMDREERTGTPRDRSDRDIVGDRHSTHGKKNPLSIGSIISEEHHQGR